MKFECSAKKLLSSLRRVMPAVSATAAKMRPVFGCVLIDAREGVVKLSTCDTAIWITAEAEVTYLQPGAVAIPADKLAATLSELGSDDITLSLEPTGRAVLHGPTGRFEFPAFPTNEFPDPPESHQEGDFFDLSAESLRALIRRTTFACDRVDSSQRFMLTGAVLERTGDSAVMVATDTKRIAVASVAVADHSREDTPVNEKPPIIPAKVLSAVDKATEQDETIRVRIRDHWAAFSSAKWTLYTSLVAGRFPPYRKLFNNKSTATIAVNSGDFLTSVRRAAVMTDQESQRIDIDFASKSATLAARGPKTGASSVQHALDYDGPEIGIAVDPAYLMDWLKAVGGEPQISIEIADANKPITLRLGDEAQYLLMPLTK